MAFFFAGMIVDFAKDAGMKVPDKPDSEWKDDEFPHFSVFCNLHLGHPLRGDWYEEFKNNAQVITKISDDQIKKVTLQDLVQQGLIV